MPTVPAVNWTVESFTGTMDKLLDLESFAAAGGASVASEKRADLAGDGPPGAKADAVERRRREERRERETMVKMMIILGMIVAGLLLLLLCIVLLSYWQRDSSSITRATASLM